MPAEKEDFNRCPSCGGRDVRRSHSRTMLDALLAAFHRVPMRCRLCRRRFYIRESALAHAPETAAGPEPTDLD